MESMERQAAGGVVLGPEGKIVLVEQHTNSWSLPKGGVNDGESSLEAAIREVGEETGIVDLELVSELGSYVRRSIAKGGVGEDPVLPARTRTMFLFRTGETQLAPTDMREVTDVRWVSLDEALGLLTHQKDKEFLASVRTVIEACLK